LLKKTQEVSFISFKRDKHDKKLRKSVFLKLNKMAHLFLTSNWFFLYDVIFELFFAITALIVSVYSFKVYKLSNQNQPKLFGIAFLSFSISYFIQSILNYLIISEKAQIISNIGILNSLGLFSHIFFFIIGLTTLAYMVLKIRSKQTYILLLSSSLLSFLIIANKLYWFYAFSSLLLIFISIYYFLNFTKNKKPKSFIIFLAFLFLLFGHIHFIFSVNHLLYYIIGHFLELLAYILILINLTLVLKNGKKKK